MIIIMPIFRVIHFEKLNSNRTPKSKQVYQMLTKSNHLKASNRTPQHKIQAETVLISPQQQLKILASANQELICFTYPLSFKTFHRKPHNVEIQSQIASVIFQENLTLTSIAQY